MEASVASQVQADFMNVFAITVTMDTIATFHIAPLNHVKMEEHVHTRHLGTIVIVLMDIQEPTVTVCHHNLLQLYLPQNQLLRHHLPQQQQQQHLHLLQVPQQQQRRLP